MSTQPVDLWSMRRKITRGEYHRMGEAGIFEGERVELIRGIVVAMSPRGTRHGGVIDALAEILIEGRRVILTTAANALLAPVHDRMPVILPRTAYAEWLDPRPRPATELAALLAPFPADLMEVYEVSTLVNKPENDGPQCIEPV